MGNTSPNLKDINASAYLVFWTLNYNYYHSVITSTDNFAIEAENYDMIIAPIKFNNNLASFSVPVSFAFVVIWVIHFDKEAIE